MSRRIRLIWTTSIVCTFFVLIATFLLLQWQEEDAPYVAGQEQEGITRSLDRSLQRASSDIRFTEVTEQAGIRFEHFPFTRTSQLPEDMGSGVAWGDYDGDGLADLFLVNFAAPVGVSEAEMAAGAVTDRLYRNRGDGTFKDVTESTGVGAAHRGMAAAWGDFDADGDLDLFTTSWGENLLWENLGGTFRDVTAKAGLGGEGYWAGAAWADFDQDGDLDLYVCGYVQYLPEEPGSSRTLAGDAQFPYTLNPSSYAPHSNRFYVNRGDGTFDELAESAGVLGENGRSLAAAWADFDQDGLPDLYVANDVSDNMLFRNRGDGTFENVSYQALVADYRGSMGIAVGDWDGDLDLDLFITHWIAQENALYSNLTFDLKEVEGSSGALLFEDAADRVGLGQIALDMIGWGTAFADLDSDGWLDLFVANGSTFQRRDNPALLVPMDPHIYWNQGATQGFYEVGETAGIRTNPPGGARGAAFADYDRDGDLDLAIVRLGGKARLLRNDSDGGHWVALRLQAMSGHPSGLGARITVHAGGRAQLREAGSGASYLSQNHSDVVVGLGSATRINRLEITWPGGSQQVWQDLAVDQIFSVVEGGEPQVIASADSTAGDASATDAQSAGRSAAPRRISNVSNHALVADLSSNLSQEQKIRFWELRKSAGRLFGNGKWAEAADLFEQMIQLEPSHKDALYYRGNSLLELERYAEAKSSWERLIEVNPVSSRAWVQMGILHALPAATEVYDLEAAATAFEKAHQINREESRPLVLWGEAAVALGRAELAARVLASAYRMNPRATSALYLSAYVSWKRGDADQSQELLRRAHRSFQAPESAGGLIGEGDTRSALMAETRKKAAQRRLFSGCLEDLRQAEPPLVPDLVFSCVDRARAELPQPD
ncbi:MAG TPA: FG-GAP-like repeat-containing protein [Pseudomonadales bacterium]|nr:FG-GAP-like repeat-containing protein [Pseudomonadales bacterium]